MSSVWILTNNDQGRVLVFSTKEKAREHFLAHRVKIYFSANPSHVEDWENPDDPSDDELADLLEYFEWDLKQHKIN